VLLFLFFVYPAKMYNMRSLRHVATENNPPPVFHKHAQDQLLKAPKTGNKRMSFNGTNSDISKLQQSTDAAASTFAIPPFRRGAAKPGSVSSDGDYFEEIIEDESMEEEIIEYDSFDSIEEEIIEDEIIEDLLPPRKITIRFDEYDDMISTIHINDYTKSEINRAWFAREDYDKMVQDSRKTADRAEERLVLQDLGKLPTKKLAKIEIRGLEAWTKKGAATTRLVKQAAIAAVWNEQNRQWDAGILADPETIRLAYQEVSQGSQAAAEALAFTDNLIVEKARQEESLAEVIKGRRNLLEKSKALLGVSVRKTGSMAVMSTKFVGKTALTTGKVAVQTASKAGVATATLDRSMLMDAIKFRENKQDRPTYYKRQSLSGKMLEIPDGMWALFKLEAVGLLCCLLRSMCGAMNSSCISPLLLSLFCTSRFRFG
jgi:hypothetical protein